MVFLLKMQKEIKADLRFFLKSAFIFHFLLTDTKSASNKTTNKSTLKKRGRKKKNNTPADTSQTAAV